MAARINNQELKRQALLTIKTGREEIRAELQSMRVELSPVRVFWRVIDRHPGAMLLTAFAAGLVPALLLSRGRRSAQRMTQPFATQTKGQAPKFSLGAHLMGMLAQNITPALIKSVIISPLLHFIIKKQADMRDPAPPPFSPPHDAAQDQNISI